MEQATKLIKLRERAGLSQERLAERLRVSRQAISKWETGVASPTTENLAVLAQIYDVDILDLLDDSAVPQPKAPQNAPPKKTALTHSRKEVIKSVIIVLLLAVIICMFAKRKADRSNSTETNFDDLETEDVSNTPRSTFEFGW